MPIDLKTLEHARNAACHEYRNYIDEEGVIQYLTNSHTLHALLLSLGIVFRVEEHRPYRIYNIEHSIAFLPCSEAVPDGCIFYVKAINEYGTCDIVSQFKATDYLELWKKYENR